MPTDTTSPGPYTASRLVARRRFTREVRIGEVRIGGSRPIAVQSMTTTPTQDVQATVDQSIRLAEAGCDVVRVTAQNVDAARALRDIRRRFTAAGFGAIPLVADIHFLPRAAMEAIEHVEKVRVNPGNYADKKKFAVKEYSDSEYDAELERLHAAFTPLVLRAKELGRALRIGTNHGSLSDRIMNRYGDSPLGMCESALEFVRICEAHGFHDIVISMKASNPKVMIQTYRLMAARMDAEGIPYPLHLGVTEAGDGDDARIKSAIGIGSLLWDGLGDTLRVSLTEDPVAEVPVGRELARKAEVLWEGAEGQRGKGTEEQTQRGGEAEDGVVDPYTYTRREVVRVDLGRGCAVGVMDPPRVILPAPLPPSRAKDLLMLLRRTHARLREARTEGLLFDLSSCGELDALPGALEFLATDMPFFVLDLKGVPLDRLEPALRAVPTRTRPPLVLLAAPESPEGLMALLAHAGRTGARLAIDATPAALESLLPTLTDVDPAGVIFTCSQPQAPLHALGTYRLLAQCLRSAGIQSPIWIRNTAANCATQPADAYGTRLLDASILTGGLLCDGIGDMTSIETVTDYAQALALAYNILQGARTRSTKTEYVACPSCGRTLFDLQTTTQRIRAATGHLKGVTIAVMGCIVNGPGEMADADFGYVGGAPGKINLYVGKTPVEFNIPSDQAVDHLVALIQKHGKWVEAGEAERLEEE